MDALEAARLRPVSPRLGRRRFADRVFRAAVFGAVIVVLMPLAAILGTIVVRGAPALNWDFLTSLPKPVGETGGGVGHAILGTLILALGGLLMAVPVGVPAGVFLASDRMPRLAGLVRMSADVLAGVPSIVVGMFAYTLLVLPFKHFSALAGAFALAVIMLPTIARTTEEVVRLVPSTLTEAALALGAPRWRVMLKVVLPSAGKGVAAGIIAAFSRGAGETAPLMFTAFGSQFLSFSPLQPIAALPLVLFNYAVSPYDDWHAQAWAAALVLAALVLAGNVIARFATARRSP
jgi:phosphate transport system permease protein